MVNKTNFYEVVVKREQYFRFPIAVTNGISKEDAMSALDNFELESHVENECFYADTDVELIDLLEPNNRWLNSNVTEDTFRQMNHSTDGALITFMSKNEDGKEEMMTEEYRKITHGQLLFGDEFSKSIE
jgi:hypothetical protein